MPIEKYRAIPVAGDMDIGETVPFLILNKPGLQFPNAAIPATFCYLTFMKRKFPERKVEVRGEFSSKRTKILVLSLFVDNVREYRTKVTILPSVEETLDLLVVYLNRNS